MNWMIDDLIAILLTSLGLEGERLKNNFNTVKIARPLQYKQVTRINKAY